MRRKKSSLLNLGFAYKRSVSGLFSSLCLLLFGLGFLFSIPFLFLSACGKKPNGNIQGREIRISYDKDNFPFSKENKDKEAEGFEVELMQKVSEKEGFHLKFLAKNHSALLPSLVTGTSDMAIGGLVREELYLLFFLTISGVGKVITHKNSEQIKMYYCLSCEL